MGVFNKQATYELRDETLNAFKNGKIGLKYIWLYFKAWLKFKFKRKK